MTSRLRALFLKEKLDAEMAEELRAHLEMQEQANRAAGMSAPAHGLVLWKVFYKQRRRKSAKSE